MASYADLLSLFAIERVGGDGTAFRPVDGLPADDDRVLGGLVLGLSLQAAAETVGEGRQVHSLHCYFLRPGRSSRPLLLAVTVVRDGRSFCVRRVDAMQEDVPIATITASYVSTDAAAAPNHLQQPTREEGDHRPQ
jgi:acyl-CoA thioesterase-2